MTKKQVVMVVILMLGAALSVLNQTSVSPMLPSIMEQMNVSSATAQWLVSGYTLVMAIFVPVSAYFMERFTTRKIFFTAIIMFIVGSVLCAIAPNFAILLIGRCLQGGSAGILMPLATAVMLLVFPLEKRGTAMGLYSLVNMLMPALGPSLTGFLTDAIGWQRVYIGIGAIALVLALLAIPTLSNYGDTADVKLDIPSVILCSLGLIGVLYGISEIGNSGIDVITVLAVVVGVVILGFFCRRQFKLEQPLLDLNVFKFFRFTMGLCILMGFQLVVNANAVVLPLLMQQGLGMTASQSGLVSLPGSLIAAVGALCAGKLFDKYGARIIATIGACVLLVGYVGLTFTGMGTSLGMLMFWNVFCSAGLIFATTPLNTWCLGFLPDELIPHGNAVSNTMRQVAAAVGTAVLVSVMSMVETGRINIGEAVTTATIAGAKTMYIIVDVCIVVIALAIAIFVKGKEKTYEKAAATVLEAREDLEEMEEADAAKKSMEIVE
ncbi:MDR family MFS transporter [Bifidobacterium choloepi]|uniref:Multidrug efflux MFS transporter n=1 Tax=Bifidobacterium choloepi TaxID=2614131 RepID=A0A6I5MZL1_9BIFI|nr:MDR family MFS transporter [Bifidobacterium choloepi]NEG69747.1 multidrug efflux MFS transporter [Bifidobacterium choloepi]